LSGKKGFVALTFANTNVGEIYISLVKNPEKRVPVK
jgi:hypothetical protein